MDQQPSVGRIVHFVMEGVESSAAHRAAIVTEVYEDAERAGMAELCVFLPEGPLMVENVRQDMDGRPLTWHWPERV